MDKKIELGSVISGTMRKEDLIPVFMDTLRYYNPESKLLWKLDQVMESHKDDMEYYYGAELSDYDLENLFNELNNICDLDNVYFGSHPGDGSDYGYWEFED